MKIKLHDIIWMSKNAGPSPIENRIELFFAGCDKAASGNPCPCCFNNQLWSRENAKDIEVSKLIDVISNKKLPKYVTLVGGEPTDQLPALKELLFYLKANSFHIILFSWHDRCWFTRNFSKQELENIDIIITEPYIESLRIYDAQQDDGLHNVIGSANQHLWANPGKFHSADVLAGDISSITLDENNLLSVAMKDCVIHELQQ